MVVVVVGMRWWEGEGKGHVRGRWGGAAGGGVIMGWCDLVMRSLGS